MSISNLFFTFGLVFSTLASAGDIKVAVITSMAGKVEIFTETVGGEKENLVIFNEKKYLSRNAKIGLKVNPGEILRTGSDGKLKVIYSTGDVVIVGPSSALTVPEKSGDDKAPKMELIYGKVRGMVEKGGPLTGLQIRTKSIVSGVRGTDLFMSYNPGSEVAEVHVIRGEVAVANVKDLKSRDQVIKFDSKEASIVKTGQVAMAANDIKTGTEKEITIKASTQQELKTIQQSTTVPKMTLEKAPIEEKKELEKLETLAATKILEDIKMTTPEVYKKMETEKLASVEQLNTAALDDVKKMAPKGSSKPKKSDFGNDEDVYKKFFKPGSSN